MGGVQGGSPFFTLLLSMGLFCTHSHAWFLLLPCRDRTCTVLNVEGDAFGAGLLQVYSEKNLGKTEDDDLVEVKTVAVEASKPEGVEEGSPLIKRNGPVHLEGSKPCEKESVM